MELQRAGSTLPFMELRVRPAYPRDIPTLVAFNRALARETEDTDLDLERLKKGVAAVFEDPARGSYFLAVIGDDPVGALLITPEWSDWRNGDFWWIQSVYVEKGHRGEGVFRRLYDHVLERARAARGVVGVRLYVENENEPAQAVYDAVGMHRARYRMYEVDFVRGGPGEEPASVETTSTVQ